MLSNTGYGSSGPWAAFRAQGTTLEATMGLSHYAGYADGPPSKVGQSYPDFLACWSGLLAVLAALVERERSGEGQWIDLGMYQLGAAVIPEALLGVQLGAQDPPRSSSGEPDARFSAVVRAAGEDRFLAVSAFTDRQLAALRATVGEPLERALAEWSRERDASVSAAVLQVAGVPAGPVLDARGLLEDPQLRHRRFYEPVECPDGVVRPVIGRPYRWQGETTAIGVRGCGPRFGEAAAWTLEALLALDDAHSAELRTQGVVTGAPVGAMAAAPLDLAVMLEWGALARVDQDYRTVLAAAVHAETTDGALRAAG
jgi:formyl-CoA transferase